MIDFHSAYLSILAGIAEYKNDKEIWWEDEYGGNITVEFVDNSSVNVVVRRYWANGNKYWKAEYREGKQHGKSIGRYENGNKWWEKEYHQGQLHGKSTGWYKNGSKYWEVEYQHGKLAK